MIRRGRNMWGMKALNPKLMNALKALVALHSTPQSSIELAKTLGVSRPTAMRLVVELRGFGCQIEAVRSTSGAFFELVDWGVFDPVRVKKFLGEK